MQDHQMRGIDGNAIPNVYRPNTYRILRAHTCGDSVITLWHFLFLRQDLSDRGPFLQLQALL
jgi:hypothetical protein